MFLKTLAASAMVLAFSVGAHAQTQSDSDQSSGQTSVPAKWIGPIAEAFYTDGTGIALRPEAEAKANFVALSPELQAQVKSDCTAMGNPTDPATTSSTTDVGNSANAKGDANGIAAGDHVADLQLGRHAVAGACTYRVAGRLRPATRSSATDVTDRPVAKLLASCDPKIAC